MNNISQSKLLQPWTWIGRRKKPPIILPPETLTNILHYFPRKQLVKQFCLVNSSFFQTANRLSSNVHVIDGYNIQFCFSYRSRNNAYDPHDNLQSLHGIIFYKDRNRRSKIGRLFCVRAKQNRNETQINAKEFLENMPPAFIRFPEFDISACPDEVLLKFLRNTKHHFVNCLLCFFGQNPDENYLQKVEEMLSDTFLNPSAIYFHTGFASEKILNTTGARNCDKVEIWMDDYQNDTKNTCDKMEICIDNAPKCTKDTFMEWIQWKQHQSGSRRHLVLVWWRFDAMAVQEMLDVFKHAFKTARKRLSYVVTFIDCWHYSHDEDENPTEFHLDNERTGERLSFFKDKKLCFRLWRRTVTSSDSTWLLALSGEIEKGVIEVARKTGFDEIFYYYSVPYINSMNNISQSKLLQPWTWFGRRKKPPIVLPPETLTNILHYFPRKQLVKRFSRVNSSFFNVANRLLPNVHVINEDNIRFSINQIFSDDRTYVQSFEALTLGKYQKSYSRFGKAMNKMTKKRITAAEYLENMPPAFIRFPKFAIHACPDEVLLKFLRDSKQNFENCRLYLTDYWQKVEEFFSDTFINPSERHLVLKGWSLELVASQELLDVFKHAFETATKPLSYVITFAEEHYDDDGNPGEFHLDNERTGERLSLFKDRRGCYRLWRRTVTSSDSTWLSALIGGKLMEKEVKEAARETGFDEKFYDYYLPRYVEYGMV
ncbi:hypothetical protein Ddc_14008 [Ditylenchus destructor]|nr:hypothetical protein Ddc_14008 [Ditylenchus destructor]